MNTEILNPPSPTIENTPLRGVTLKIIISIIISTALSVGSVLGAYYGSQRKNDIQDLQIETLKLEVQTMKVDLHDMQNQINSKKDKTDK